MDLSNIVEIINYCIEYLKKRFICYKKIREYERFYDDDDYNYDSDKRIDDDIIEHSFTMNR